MLNLHTCERKKYVTLARRRQHGRTQAFIICPFCSREVTVYVWSLAGSGKRCKCGILFGTEYAFDDRERM